MLQKVFRDTEIDWVPAQLMFNQIRTVLIGEYYSKIQFPVGEHPF